jgi:nitroreductase
MDALAALRTRRSIRELLAVPDKYTLVAYLSLGYPKGDHPDPPDKLNLSDLLHWERYSS